jgi:hypothetical protein
MNLTNLFRTLSNKIEDVYQTKLKTDVEVHLFYVEHTIK